MFDFTPAQRRKASCPMSMLDALPWLKRPHALAEILQPLCTIWALEREKKPAGLLRSALYSRVYRQDTEDWIYPHWTGEPCGADKSREESHALLTGALALSRNGASVHCSGESCLEKARQLRLRVSHSKLTRRAVVQELLNQWSHIVPVATHCMWEQSSTSECSSSSDPSLFSLLPTQGEQIRQMFEENLNHVLCSTSPRVIDL